MVKYDGDCHRLFGGTSVRWTVSDKTPILAHTRC
jgi:hypothetical protein